MRQATPWFFIVLGFCLAVIAFYLPWTRGAIVFAIGSILAVIGWNELRAEAQHEAEWQGFKNE